MSGKYLVQTYRDDYLNFDILVTVYEVLKLIEDTDYGTIVIANYVTDEGGKVECLFLEEALSYDYKFSNDEKYKDWINS